MNTYKIRINPDIRHALSSVEPTLTKKMLVDAIPDIVVRGMSDRQWGPRIIDVQLDRATHEQALEEIVSAVQWFGFSLAEAVVSEWADNATERAIRWMLGEGAVDVAAENPAVGILAAIIGGVVGLFVSTEERKLEAQYEAHRLYYGWAFRETPRQQLAGPLLRPVVSPG